MSERDQSRAGSSPVGQSGDASWGVGSGARGSAGPDENYSTSPNYSTAPVALRGPESLGGLLLILAGIAAAISLPLDWIAAVDVTGLDLVRKGFDDVGGIFGDGLWQPMAIILGGGVLFLLGILLWLPAKSHRFLGLVALVISGVIVAAVLVPLVDAGWELGDFGLGFWFAVAVAVLGLLGSLKAVLTGKRYRT
jgi:hypothetical protein